MLLPGLTLEVRRGVPPNSLENYALEKEVKTPLVKGDRVQASQLVIKAESVPEGWNGPKGK